jgi:putative mycofactocin binding protein MftB
VFDPEARWQLHSQVELRPEPFGALLYHFGTRKLSFLKSPVLVAVVRALSTQPSARLALRACDADQPAYVKALATLADSHMLVRAT